MENRIVTFPGGQPPLHINCDGIAVELIEKLQTYHSLPDYIEYEEKVEWIARALHAVLKGCIPPASLHSTNDA